MCVDQPDECTRDFFFAALHFDREVICFLRKEAILTDPEQTCDATGTVACRANHIAANIVFGYDLLPLRYSTDRKQLITQYLGGFEILILRVFPHLCFDRFFEFV